MHLALLRPESLVIFQVQSLSVPLNEHGSLTSPRTSLDLNFDFQKTRLPFSGSLQFYPFVLASSSVFENFLDDFPPAFTNFFATTQIIAGNAFYPFHYPTSTPSPQFLFLQLSQRNKRENPTRGMIFIEAGSHLTQTTHTGSNATINR
jgi:hypothetical protein